MIALVLFIVCLAGAVLAARDFHRAAKPPQASEPETHEASPAVQAPPKRAVEYARAMIQIRVPSDADLWLGSERNKQSGRSRSYQTPPLEVGKDYEVARAPAGSKATGLRIRRAASRFGPVVMSRSILPNASRPRRRATNEHPKEPRTSKRFLSRLPCVVFYRARPFFLFFAVAHAPSISVR